MDTGNKFCKEDHVTTRLLKTFEGNRAAKHEKLHVAAF